MKNNGSIIDGCAKHKSRTGHWLARLWLPGVCGIMIVISGTLLVRSWGSNSASEQVPKAVAPTVAPAAAHVSMRNLQFDPVTVTVKKGDMVEWKNDDLVPHTATATPASFNSGTIASGKSWRHTFTATGNFPYICIFHPQMKGMVIVKEL